jgi:hypothetical protein
VTAEDEAIESDALNDSEQTHQLSIAAECSTRAVADLDDALHDLAAAGLTLIFAPTPPYGLTLQGIARSLATEGEAAVGRITLNLNATFLTAPSAPETIL